MIRQLHKKMKLFIVYLLIAIIYFIYVVIDSKKIFTIKQNYFSTKELLQQEREITKKFESLKNHELLSSEENSAAKIYSFLSNNTRIKLHGFIPNQDVYHITITGDYFDLLDTYQNLLTQFKFKTRSLTLLLPENSMDFSLNLQLSTSAALLNEDRTSTKDISSFSTAIHLRMIGYLAYGLEHWCVIEDENHITQLIKEGSEIKQGTIQSIQPKHLFIKNHAQNFLVPLSLPFTKK